MVDLGESVDDERLQCLLHEFLGGTPCFIAISTKPKIIS
jgi:hypothetical protein